MMQINFANPLKWVFLGMILLKYLWELWTFRLSDKQLRKPLPASVQDIYDAEAYDKWLAYRGACRRMALIRGAFTTAWLLFWFAFDLYALVYRLLGLNTMADGWGAVPLMAVCVVIDTLIGLPFDYISTFRIEETYGFNRTTRKTFWLDQLKGAILSICLSCALVAAVSLLYGQGVWLVVKFGGLLMAFTLIASLFSLPLQRLFNKFTPLPEGSLRTRLEALFAANGYTAKRIYVMDASRRTTKANAFCTGIGRGKKVALYDNLVNNYHEEEVAAVFAHELGHAKHRDTLVMTLLNMLRLAVMAVFIGWMVSTDAVSVAMGFDAVNTSRRSWFCCPAWCWRR